MDSGTKKKKRKRGTILTGVCFVRKGWTWGKQRGSVQYLPTELPGRGKGWVWEKKKKRRKSLAKFLRRPKETRFASNLRLRHNVLKRSSRQDIPSYITYSLGTGKETNDIMRTMWNFDQVIRRKRLQKLFSGARFWNNRRKIIKRRDSSDLIHA